MSATSFYEHPVMHRPTSSATGASSASVRRNARSAATAAVIRRRPNVQQGRALEALGHAIEYLIDSQLHLGADTPASGAAANQILMRLSRAVFAECPEVVSLRSRVRRSVLQFLAGDGLEDAAHAQPHTAR